MSESSGTFVAKGSAGAIVDWESEGDTVRMAVRFPPLATVVFTLPVKEDGDE